MRLQQLQLRAVPPNLCQMCELMHPVGKTNMLHLVPSYNYIPTLWKTFVGSGQAASTRSCTLRELSPIRSSLNFS